MEKKTYRYFVSFAYSIMCSTGIKYHFGNTVLVYDEPIDTQDMLVRSTRDITNQISCDKNVIILFFKRIKDNR